MCMAPALEEKQILQMDWHCEKCDKSGTITYPMGELPELITERLMTSHESVSEDCGYSHQNVVVKSSREVTNEE